MTSAQHTVLWAFALLTSATIASGAQPLQAQTGWPTNGGYAIPPEEPDSTPYAPNEVRVVVSVPQRQLWVIAEGDTVRQATVSVASGRELNFGGRRWRFATPRGALTVKGKRTDPVWLPPDWHYAEIASTHNLKLRTLPASGVTLKDRSRLLVRDSVAGLIMPGDSTFLPLPVDEHLIFDSTLFVPPLASHNRRLAGELGRYALDLGSGYMLHGTFDQSTIGIDTTHGCIRLADDDLEWLYRNVPVGARVEVR